jgi:hypothetical protein
VRYRDLKLRDAVTVAIMASLIFVLFAFALSFWVLAPLLGAALFAGLAGYGLLTGEMPTRFGPDPERCESPFAFWAVGGIYAAGCVGCLIWFAVSLLN